MTTFTARSLAAQQELIRDAHFGSGFYLLDSKPGKRVVYGQLPGMSTSAPVWDLAQWSSRFPLVANQFARTAEGMVHSNEARSVTVGLSRSSAADISLAVNGSIEYPRARKSIAEPWVHLLLQQDLTNPPSLGRLGALNFRVEARLKRSTLVDTNEYSPGLHAAQFLVYLTVANRSPTDRGYNECFWFGIPIYDSRERMVSPYEAQDFGDTKLFIFTPGAASFTDKSIHDGKWTTFQRDLLPLIREGLNHARGKGFIKGSANLNDYRPLGIFVGWEVPGRFDVDLQIRNLSLQATEPDRGATGGQGEAVSGSQ